MLIFQERNTNLFVFEHLFVYVQSRCFLLSLALGSLVEFILCRRSSSLTLSQKRMYPDSVFPRPTAFSVNPKNVSRSAKAKNSTKYMSSFSRKYFSQKVIEMKFFFAYLLHRQNKAIGRVEDEHEPRLYNDHG